MVRMAISAVLATLLAASPARAGTVGATLTLDQLTFQPSGDYTLRYSSSALRSRVINVDNDLDITDGHGSDAFGAALATSLSHNGAHGQGWWDPLGGNASLSIAMSDADGPWRYGETALSSNTVFELAPGASLSFSAHVRLQFQDSTTGDALSTMMGHICLGPVPGACSLGYFRSSMLGTEPGGFAETVSATWSNHTGSPQQVIWSTDLLVNAMPPAVPEPAAWSMLGAGLALCVTCRKRYRRA